MGWGASIATLAGSLAVLAGACKGNTEATDSVSLPLVPGAVNSAGVGALDIPDLAPEYVANLDSTAVLLDVETSVPALAHRLMVPKSWTAKKAAHEKVGPFEAATLSVVSRDAKADSPSVTVAVREAPFEVPVDAVMRRVFEGEGWAIQRSGWFPGRNGLYFDLTGVMTSAGVTRVRRTTARAAAGRIFEVNALSTRSDWDSNKAIFWAAGSSFELHEGAGQTRLEQWRRYAGNSPAFELAYPESWQSEAVPPPSSGVSAVNLRLLGPAGDVLLAYLQVRAEESGGKPPPLDARLAKALERVKRQGMQPVEDPRRLSEDEDPRSSVVTGWLGTFLGRVKTPDGSSADLRIGFLDQPRVQFQLVAISPTLGDDPIAALRAQRAFEIVRQTLKPPEPNK